VHELLGNGGVTKESCDGRARGGIVDYGEHEASKAGRNKVNEGSNGHIVLFTPRHTNEQARWQRTDAMQWPSPMCGQPLRWI
jgi:hypothetical protein